MIASPYDPPRKRLLLAGIGTGVLGLIALALLTRAVAGDVRLATAIGRPIVFAAIGALALGGRPVPRAALMLWSGLLAFFAAFAAMTLLRTGHLRDGVLFLALGVVFLGSFLLLLRAGRKVASPVLPAA